MDTNTLKICVQSTKSGQLNDTINILNGKFVHLKTEEALKILICVCNACVDSQVQAQFTPNDVSRLMEICLKKIQNRLDSNLMHSFLASMYYIIKYLIDMKDYNCIINLRQDTIKIIGNHLEDNKLIRLVGNIHKIIYNAIISTFSEIGSKDISALCLFSMEILKESKELSVLLKEEWLDCFKSCNYMRVDLRDQYDMYMWVLQSIKSKSEKEPVIYFHSIVSVLNIILKNYLKDDKVAMVKELIFNTTKTFKHGDVSEELQSIFIIMENVVLMISSEDEFPPNMKDILSRINEHFQMVYNNKKFLQSVLQFSKFLHIILYYALQNFADFSKEFWNSYNMECLIILNKFVINVTISLSWVYSKCKVCDDCNLNYDFIAAAGVCIIPAQILKYCISNGNNGDIDAPCKEINKSLEISCTMVQKMQEFKCVNWKTVWTEIGTLIYNLSVVLCKMKHTKTVFYTNYFIKKMILFEGVKKSMVKENILNSALSNLTEAYIKLKDHKKAMAVCALNIFLHPENRESVFWQWVRIKLSEKEDKHIQNANLVSVITNSRSLLSNLYPDFAITEADKKNLLLFESKQYKKVWPSKISLVSVFKELHTFNDTLVLVKALVSIWGDSENNISIDLYDIVFDVVVKFEKEMLKSESTTENSLYMAFLYLIQYYLIYRKRQQKNRVDMEATSIEGSETETYENDLCDVVSSYESLTIDAHIQIMSYLKKSLDTFKCQVCEENEEVLREKNVYFAVNNVANEYLLQCHTLEYIQAWTLGYRLAKILKDKICIIESIAHLLEKSDPNSTFIKSAVLEAENLILQVQNDAKYKEEENAIRRCVVICNFYINRGWVSLNCGDADSALNLFKQAKKVYEGRIDSANFELLRVKYEFFEWRLQLLPCKFKIEGHSWVLSKPHILMELIGEQYKANGSNTYVLCMLFELFTAVVHYYRWMRQPREVRCYARDLIVLSQKLLIPFRSIRILSHLADADLLSQGVDDCRVKINGICDILGYSKEKPSGNCVGKEEKLIAKEMNTMTNTFQAMKLDVPPASIQYYQATSGSPVLLRGFFKRPTFIEHENACCCFCCLSIDYQEHVLICIASQGNLSHFEKNTDAAIEYYQGALDLYQRILDKEKSFQTRMEEILNLRVFPTIEYKLKETYCVILLGLGNCLIRDEKFEKFSTELTAILKKSNYFNPSLYMEALYQQLTYINLKEEETKNSRASPMRECSGDEEAITPENKCTQVTLKKVPRTPVSTATKRVVKVIKFDLSDTEDAETATKKAPVTPAAYLPKTPAMSASKIKVYNPTTIKSSRKKNVAAKIDFGSEQKENAELKFEFQQPSTQLKLRTKLLTEKVKNSSVVPSIVVTDGTESETSKTPSETRVRTRGTTKKCMSQLSTKTDENTTASASTPNNANNDNKGAIKKHVTRSRKLV